MQEIKDGVYGKVEELDFEKALREKLEGHIDGIAILTTEKEIADAKARIDSPVMSNAQLKKIFNCK